MGQGETFPAPRLRRTDAIAEQLLDVVLRLERAPWPRAQQSYAAGLIGLATRCDLGPAKAEIYRWFAREAGGSLVVSDERHRENLRDAFHEAVTLIPDLLLRFRAGLDPDRRPNLRSMLVKWIHWRAGDLHDAERRHTGRCTSLQVDDRAVPARAELAVELGEVLALLDGEVPRVRALRLVGLGYSVAEAARLTGASRQQIYRVRDALWWTCRGVEAPRRKRGAAANSADRRRRGVSGDAPDEGGQ